MSKTESRLVEFESLRYNFLENHYCYNKISPEKVNTNKKKKTAGVFNIEIKLKEIIILHIAKFNSAKMKAEFDLP